MKPIVLILTIGLCSFSISAQNLLQRATVGNSGSSTEIKNSENTYYISQSVGQSSVTGTLINGEKVIRQGYQQPPIRVEIISDNISDLEAVVYPNPVETIITVQFSEKPKTPINIMIYDVSGKVIVETFKNPTITFNIDMSAYSSGIYLLNLNSGSRKFTARLIKK